MCGIAGIFTANENCKIDNNLLSRMSSKLEHRGPDSNGQWIADSGEVGFAHARLAIQDLSPTGHQPMVSRSKRYVLTYNGEIYNFPSLKLQLENEGVKFNGNSDTEVLLAGIEAWGLDKTLAKTEGMFAFGLWDNKEKNLYLVRDRIGEKPLYFGLFDNTLVFASQLSAIEEIGILPCDISNEAVRLFLRYGYIPAPYAIYENVFKLLPGDYLTVNYNKLAMFGNNKINFASVEEHFKLTKYWDVRDIAKANVKHCNSDEKQNTDILQNLLENTIKDQMGADVPYGAFLSGGIDSSLVVSVMQSISASPVKTFTIGFENKEFNEAIYAKQISDYLGTDHTELYVTDNELLDVIPKLHSIYDEPFADPSQIPTYIVSMMSKQHVSVALSGDGGDEFFAGYNRYRMLQLWNIKQQIPEVLQKYAVNPSISLYKHLAKGPAKNILKLLNKNQGPQTNVASIVDKIERIMKYRTHNEAYQYMLSLMDTPDNYLVVKPDVPEPDFFVNEDGLDKFQSMLLWDQLLYLPGDNLVKVDRASMAVSLETRHPLLNHKIIEHSWLIPESQKMTKKDNKLILKNLLRRYLPNEMIERPKMGFSVPVQEWLNGPLKEWATDLLSKISITNGGVLDYQAAAQTWDDFNHGKTSNIQFIWRLLILQDWLENR